MGLLKMLAFPVTGPLWVAQIVRDEAERRLYDVESIRRQLADLQDQHEVGLVSREVYEQTGENLLERLLDAGEYHRRKQLDQQDSEP